MKNMALILMTFSLVFVACLRTTLAADTESLRTRIDRIAKPYIDSNIVVGMTIGVLRDGKTEVFGYGRMSREDKRVPDGDTIYELGSATKVLTGILLADAIVNGKAKLDQPATELLPSNVKMPTSGTRSITLQDLATHVSGLPRLPDNMNPQDENNPYADYREEDLFTFLNNYSLPEPPGKRIEYSNLGMGLLGYLLARQAKMPYADLLKDHLTAPLKMTSTKITVDSESRTRFAPGYTSDGTPTANWDLPVLVGAGGVRTSVNDMLLFAAANISPPKGKLGEAIEMAWTIHQQPIEKTDSPNGLGWQVIPDGSRWHNGETGGYHSILIVNRKSKLSVVVLSNTAAEEVDQLATDTFLTFSGVKVSPRKFEKPIEVKAEVLQTLAGIYKFPSGPSLTIEVVDEKLMATLTGQGANQVYPRSETAWFYKGIDATLTFNKDKKGNFESLVLHQNGIKQTAKRQSDNGSEPPKEEKLAEVSTEAMQKLVGTYELKPGLIFTVEIADEKLMIALTGQPSYQVFPRSETVWFYKVVDATITFNVKKNGTCDSLVLAQNGAKQTAKRKK